MTIGIGPTTERAAEGGYPLGSGGIEAANTCIDAYDMEIVDYH